MMIETLLITVATLGFVVILWLAAAMVGSWIDYREARENDRWIAEYKRQREAAERALNGKDEND
jgi:hypothetical protein